jgi:proteasome-associated ATPase
MALANRDKKKYDDRFERPEGRMRAEENRPRGPETSFRSLNLIDRILQISTTEDPRVVQQLLLLRHQIEVDEQQFEEAQKLIAEYEEAYQKLTSPANRIGTFLGSPEEGIASVALGDSEFYSNVDPNLDESEFKVGTRVKVNEAYAVVGDLGYHTSGPIVKVAEVLDEERLRVSMDAQGQTGRVVVRSSDLMELPLKVGDEVRMEPNFRVALEHFAQKEVRDFYLEDVPEIPWEKVGGQEEDRGDPRHDRHAAAVPGAV